MFWSGSRSISTGQEERHTHGDEVVGLKPVETVIKQHSEEIEAFNGKDTVFDGKMRFQGIFHLDGRFEGEILDSGTLIVGETAIVKGKLRVNTLIVKGIVEGETTVNGRVEVHSTGKIVGTLFTPVLIINEGGILEGECKMNAKLATPDEVDAEKAP